MGGVRNFTELQGCAEVSQERLLCGSGAESCVCGSVVRMGLCQFSPSTVHVCSHVGSSHDTLTELRCLFASPLNKDLVAAGTLVRHIVSALQMRQRVPSLLANQRRLSHTTSRDVT